MTHYSIAIDGPSGAGKSTLARALADRLGFFYVDTGAIYRTLGLYIARQGGDCGQKADVVSRSRFRSPGCRRFRSPWPMGRMACSI